MFRFSRLASNSRMKVTAGVVAGVLAVVPLGSAASLTIVSDGSTLAAATAENDPALTTGVTTGLTFGADVVGGLGSFTSPPPGAPAGTDVVNIDSTGGASGFFEVQFTLPAGFSGASISGAANADDQGYVFLNGTELTSLTEFGDATFSASNPALFQAGVNTFLVSDINSGGGPSAASFFATVNYTTAAAGVPEPGAFGLALVPFLAALLFAAGRKRARGGSSSLISQS